MITSKDDQTVIGFKILELVRRMPWLKASSAADLVDRGMADEIYVPDAPTTNGKAPH